MRLFLFILALVWAAKKKEYNLPSTKDIVIITRDKCGFSRLMREYLENKEIDFEDINVSVKGRGILKELGLDNKTFPMVFVKKIYVGGYTDGIKTKEFVDYIENYDKDDKKKIISGRPDFISPKNSNL